MNRTHEQVGGDNPAAVRIAGGEYTAVLDLRSGGIASLLHRGRPLLESYEAGTTPPVYANVVLAPWPNRVEDGRFLWKGRKHQLTLSEPERGHAIHGLVHDRWWSLDRHEASEAELRITIQPEQGWPWQLNLSAHYVLDAEGLTCRYTADTEEESVPFAFGLHTFLSAHGAPVDDCTLHAPLAEHHLLDARSIPTGEIEPAEVDSAIARLTLDDLYRAEGKVFEVRNPAGGGVRMVTDLPWIQLCTPATYPGRGRVIAVEPMSAPTNALATGTGLSELTPGARWEALVRFSSIDPG